MPYALLSMLWTSVLAYLLTIGAGLNLWNVDKPLQVHVIAALTTTILALFAHTMTMFYFIGSAKKIKDFIVDWDPEIKQELRARMIAVKRKLFPWMMLACLGVMAAFIMGGAYDAGRVGRSVHMWIAYGALILHVHVSMLESVHIFRNINLILEINDLSRRRTQTEGAAKKEA